MSPRLLSSSTHQKMSMELLSIKFWGKTPNVSPQVKWGSPQVNMWWHHLLRWWWAGDDITSLWTNQEVTWVSPSRGWHHLRTGLTWLVLRGKPATHAWYLSVRWPWRTKEFSISENGTHHTDTRDCDILSRFMKYFSFLNCRRIKCVLRNIVFVFWRFVCDYCLWLLWNPAVL